MPALFVLAILVRRQSARACFSISLIAGYIDVTGWSTTTIGRLAMSYVFAGAIVLTITTAHELSSAEGCLLGLSACGETRSDARG